MKFLIYGLNYTPELTGIGKYSGEMAAWLAGQGHEVRVVTTPPYYPDWKVGEGYTASSYRRETFAGVDVLRCPLWVPVRPSGLKRLIHLASFALSSFPVLLRLVFWRPDVVWVAAPAFFCAPGAWLAARLSGAKCWLHIQDFEVDAAFDLGLLKGARLRRWVLAAERWMLQRFDVVSTISNRMLERVLEKGVARERAVLFPNWVDVGAIAPNSFNGLDGRKLETSLRSFSRLRGNDGVVHGGGVVGFREELGIPDDAVVALYSGNMGAKQGLEILADAARLVGDWGVGGDDPGLRPSACIQATGFFGAQSKQPPFPSPSSAGAWEPVTEATQASGDIDNTIPAGGGESAIPGLRGRVVFVFCGNGSGRADLEARCAGSPNVRFLDLQPLERLGELLTMADVHLLPQRGDAADLVMPSKLTGMLASGRPVVATAHPGTELAQVVAGCGVVVPPEVPEAFAAAILDLAADAPRRARLGLAARRYAEEHLDKDAVLRRFEARLLNLSGKVRSPTMY